MMKGMATVAYMTEGFFVYILKSFRATFQAFCMSIFFLLPLYKLQVYVLQTGADLADEDHVPSGALDGPQDRRVLLFRVFQADHNAIRGRLSNLISHPLYRGDYCIVDLLKLDLHFSARK